MSLAAISPNFCMSTTVSAKLPTARTPRACRRAAAQAGLRLLVAVGGQPARALAKAAVSAGMPASAVVHFDRSESAAVVVKSALRAGDLVLVKGSRGIRTELVVERIVAEFA